MTSSRRSVHCPECKSTHIAFVMMGMPLYDDELERKLKEGKIILGGCVVSDGDPNFVCNDCKHQWRRDGKKVEYPVDTDDDWLGVALDDVQAETHRS